MKKIFLASIIGLSLFAFACSSSQNASGTDRDTVSNQSSGTNSSDTDTVGGSQTDTVGTGSGM